MSLVEKETERLLEVLDDNARVMTIGIPPSRETLRERLDLVFHPERHPFQQVEVTVGKLRELYVKEKQGGKLSTRESEILGWGVFALGLNALNTGNYKSSHPDEYEK